MHQSMITWLSRLHLSINFFNSDHPAGMTPKKTSRMAGHRKGFIMYKGGEHKADLGHFILETAAVCTKVR